MADEKPAAVPKVVKPKAPKPEYVTEERFASLEGSVNKMLDMLSAQQAAKPEPKVETPIEKEIRKAGPNDEMVNPHWVEMAKEIIGEAVDHCEVFYPKGGGTVFTVVIKDGMSNASKDYLERMKSDRRSKELGSEGIGGVELFCKLIKQNLARPR